MLGRSSFTSTEHRGRQASRDPTCPAWVTEEGKRVRAIVVDQIEREEVDGVFRYDRGETAVAFIKDPQVPYLKGRALQDRLHRLVEGLRIPRKLIQYRHEATRMVSLQP